MIPKTSSTGECVHYDCEYVLYDYEKGEYVVEKNTKTKDSNPTKASTPENKKPGHQRAEPNVYDELDYELSPRVEVSNKKEGLSKQNKIIIVSVLVVCVVGALFLAFYFGAVFGSEGK